MPRRTRRLRQAQCSDPSIFRIGGGSSRQCLGRVRRGSLLRPLRRRIGALWGLAHRWRHGRFFLSYFRHRWGAASSLVFCLLGFALPGSDVSCDASRRIVGPCVGCHVWAGSPSTRAAMSASHGPWAVRAEGHLASGSITECRVLTLIRNVLSPWPRPSRVLEPGRAGPSWAAPGPGGGGRGPDQGRGSCRATGGPQGQWWTCTAASGGPALLPVVDRKATGGPALRQGGAESPGRPLGQTRTRPPRSLGARAGGPS